MDVVKDQLANLRRQVWFQDFTKRVLLTSVPEIIPYTDGQKPEDWAYSTGFREGYIHALKMLGIENAI